jgi:ribosomal protein S6--L-glutamate ligase
MHISSLEEFLLEAKDSKDQTNLVVFTAKPENSDTALNFKKVAESRGMKVYLLDPSLTTLKPDKKTGFFKFENTDTGKGPVLDRKDTCILSRRGILINTFTKNLLHQLEQNKFFCINTLESMEVCENKYLTSVQLENSGIPVPKTALLPNEDSIDKAVKQIGGKFPVVVKLLSGTQGIGVSIVDSYSSLMSVFQTFKKLDKSAEILIQEMIPSNYDIRIQVITKKFDTENVDDSIIIGEMRRNRIKKDFRTNFSLGATTQKIKLTDEIAEMARKAARIVGCTWCGVDIIVDKESGKPYVLEVNSSPGTKGIEKTTGKSMVTQVIDYIADRANWSSHKIETGFREVIDIDGIGKFIAKFDTGNGAKSCSMHVDSYEEKDGELIWTLKKKTYKNKIVGHSNAEVGHRILKRPIIYMDITFAGKTLRDVPVSPVDRKAKSTPFLANREYMERMGIMVNPEREFGASDIAHVDKNFNPKKAKGDQHAGIAVDNDTEEE